MLSRKHFHKLLQKCWILSCRPVTSLFRTGSRGPQNWENYQHFGKLRKNCTPFKWGKKIISFYIYSNLKDWVFSLSLFEKFYFLNCFKKIVIYVNAIGNFSTWNWENTSIFAIGNGADFRPQLEGREGPVMQ